MIRKKIVDAYMGPAIQLLQDFLVIGICLLVQLYTRQEHGRYDRDHDNEHVS